MYNINEETKNNDNYFDYYTIKKGDNLYNIAKKYNVNPTLLATLNGLNLSDYIYPEQVIIISKSNFAYYITKEGDTLKLVAETFNTSENNLLKYNPKNTMETNQAEK